MKKKKKKQFQYAFISLEHTVYKMQFVNYNKKNLDHINWNFSSFCCCSRSAILYFIWPKPNTRKIIWQCSHSKNTEISTKNFLFQKPEFGWNRRGEQTDRKKNIYSSKNYTEPMVFLRGKATSTYDQLMRDFCFCPKTTCADHDHNGMVTKNDFFFNSRIHLSRNTNFRYFRQ